MKVYYRLSNIPAGKPKKKIANATKENCLKNCTREFGKENITVVGDSLNNQTKNLVNSLGLRLIEVDNGSGSGTFRDALNLAIDENDDNTMVYLLEDDFLHLPGSRKLLEEGVEHYKWYATLYDHPDKYSLKRYSQDKVKLFRTKSAHWKTTPSTVMSFASYVSRLKQDLDLFKKYSQGKITQSHQFFTELMNTKQVGVVSSVPGYSTHCELKFLSPFTDWEEV